MSMTVRIPAGMRHVTQDQSEVTADGESVSDMIADLERSFPGIQALLCDDEGRLHKFVMLAVDGVDVKTLDGLNTAIPPTASIDIVRAIAGG